MARQLRCSITGDQGCFR